MKKAAGKGKIASVWRTRVHDSRSLRFHILCTILIALCVLSAPDARAQDVAPTPTPTPSPSPSPTPSPSPPTETEETIETVRVDIDLVNLNVSVISRDPQQTIGRLEQKDFAIFENGAAEEISFFAASDAPFDLVLLLDLSGSTADKLKLLRRSARRFVEATRPADRIAVVTFSSQTQLVAPLTSDRAELKRRIDKIAKPEGGTRFWDALRFSLEQVLEKGDNQRRSAIVVMTDGVDNALPDVPGEGSVTSFEELLEMLGRSETIVLPVYLDTEREMVRQRRVLRTSFIEARAQLARLADQSGSIVYYARKLEDLKGVYEQVIRDLSTVYSIGYRPANTTRDGSWRAITVKLLNRPHLAARTKRGYFAK